jgi:hypothetical protein
MSLGKTTKRRFFFLIVLISVSCSSPNKIDKDKFENLFRAAKAMEACSITDPLYLLRQKERDLKTECAVAESVVETEAEITMVGRFNVACLRFEGAFIQIEGTYIRDEAYAWQSAKDARTSWADGTFALQEASRWYLNGEILSGGGTVGVKP